MVQTNSLVLVSERSQESWDVLAPFRAHGFVVHVVPTVERALDLLDPAHPASLVLFDSGAMERDAVRHAIMRMLARCALTPMVLLSDRSPEELHEDMEGLGLLPALPLHPTAADGAALLAALMPTASKA